jgi:hypothetical protein
VLADTFDPGWSATVDDTPAPIHPAYVAFRAVALPPGHHRVVFRYQPAGFVLGMVVSAVGFVVFLVMWFLSSAEPQTAGDHDELPGWARSRKLLLGLLVAIVVLSLIQLGNGPQLSIQSRWRNSFHRFTWGAGIEAMKQNRQ